MLNACCPLNQSSSAVSEVSRGKWRVNDDFLSFSSVQLQSLSTKNLGLNFLIYLKIKGVMIITNVLDFWSKPIQVCLFQLTHLINNTILLFHNKIHCKGTINPLIVCVCQKRIIIVSYTINNERKKVIPLYCIYNSMNFYQTQPHIIDIPRKIGILNSKYP